MTHNMVSPLVIARDLESAGVERHQAEVIAAAIHQSSEDTFRKSDAQFMVSPHFVMDCIRSQVASAVNRLMLRIILGFLVVGLGGGGLSLINNPIAEFVDRIF